MVSYQAIQQAEKSFDMSGFQNHLVSQLTECFKPKNNITIVAVDGCITSMNKKIIQSDDSYNLTPNETYRA